MDVGKRWNIREPVALSVHRVRLVARSGRLSFATPNELLHSGGSGWRLSSNKNETHVGESSQASGPCMSSTRSGAVYKPTYEMTVGAVTANTEESKTVAKETQNMDVSELVLMLLEDR